MRKEVKIFSLDHPEKQNKSATTRGEIQFLFFRQHVLCEEAGLRVQILSGIKKCSIPKQNTTIISTLSLPVRHFPESPQLQILGSQHWHILNTRAALPFPCFHNSMLRFHHIPQNKSWRLITQLRCFPACLQPMSQLGSKQKTQHSSLIQVSPVSTAKRQGNLSQRSYLVCESSIQQVSSLGVNNSFGFPSAAWGVQHEEHIFTVHALWRAGGICLGHLLRKKTWQWQKDWVCGAKHHHSLCKQGNSIQRQEPPLLLPLTNVHGYIRA